MKKSKKEEINQLAKMEEKSINYDDIPKTDSGVWQDAEVMYPVKKKPIFIKLDEDIIRWFKSYGRGYQSRINAVLKSYMQSIEKHKG